MITPSPYLVFVVLCAEVRNRALLYPSFASPWADADSKSVEPDFQLPSCYTVHNVQPLGSKVAAFSDETLFYIFYTMPRDVMQEVVATEL